MKISQFFFLVSIFFACKQKQNYNASLKSIDDGVTCNVPADRALPHVTVPNGNYFGYHWTTEENWKKFAGEDTPTKKGALRLLNSMSEYVEKNITQKTNNNVGDGLYVSPDPFLSPDYGSILLIVKFKPWCDVATAMTKSSLNDPDALRRVFTSAYPALFYGWRRNAISVRSKSILDLDETEVIDLRSKNSVPLAQIPTFPSDLSKATWRELAAHFKGNLALPIVNDLKAPLSLVDVFGVPNREVTRALIRPLFDAIREESYPFLKEYVEQVRKIPDCKKEGNFDSEKYFCTWASWNNVVQGDSNIGVNKTKSTQIFIAMKLLPPGAPVKPEAEQIFASISKYLVTGAPHKSQVAQLLKSIEVIHAAFRSQPTFEDWPFPFKSVGSD